LVILFGKFATAIADLGPYEFISRTQACHGRGLVALIDLLQAIVELCPGAELATGAAKQALLLLVVQRPEINTSKYNNGIWAGLRVERLATILNHLRRISREPGRLAQVASKVTGPEFAQLKKLASLVQAKAYGQVEDEDDDQTVYVPDLGPRSSSPDLEPRSSSSKQPPSAQPSPSTVAGTNKKRQLSVQVSLDADGFPKMLTGSVPAMPVLKQPRSLKKEVSLDDEGHPAMLTSRASSRTAMALATAAAPTAGIATQPRQWHTMFYRAANAVGVRERGANRSSNSSTSSGPGRSWRPWPMRPSGSLRLAMMSRL